MSLKSRFIISFIIITLIVAVEINMQHWNRPQRKRTTQGHLVKRFGERNVDGRLQVKKSKVKNVDLHNASS